ncbi:uncharacterized protein LOC142344129 [Convolutriloba macropyga]|uniref:uncharacterized protein LOC142344129 n=1 Tax=Convolutriloba macropyga TaxID=536237 RepID=UPI003F51F58D
MKNKQTLFVIVSLVLIFFSFFFSCFAHSKNGYESGENHGGIWRRCSGGFYISGCSSHDSAKLRSARAFIVLDHVICLALTITLASLLCKNTHFAPVLSAILSFAHFLFLLIGCSIMTSAFSSRETDVSWGTGVAWLSWILSIPIIVLTGVMAVCAVRNQKEEKKQKQAKAASGKGRAAIASAKSRPRNQDPARPKHPNGSIGANDLPQISEFEISEIVPEDSRTINELTVIETVPEDSNVYVPEISIQRGTDGKIENEQKQIPEKHVYSQLMNKTSKKEKLNENNENDTEKRSPSRKDDDTSEEETVNEIEDKTELANNSALTEEQPCHSGSSSEENKTTDIDLEKNESDQD